MGDRAKKSVMVSILCITYNQVDYIKDAIESFLAQKTDFEYEILIHDDASDDGTAEIVKHYAGLFPDKIRIVIQDINQYSKGIKVMPTYLYPLVKGKYIAICEGDDFWTDNCKLKKQYDYMEQHPDCAMCIHDGWYISEDKKTVHISKPLTRKPCIFGMEDAIKQLGIKTVTNSFFFRAQIIKKAPPQFMVVAPTGDYGIVIQNALYGYIYYMPEKMSAHRCSAKNSLTVQWNENPECWKKYIEKQIIMLDCLNADTNYQYSDLIEQEKVQQIFDNYIIANDLDNLNKEPYRSMMHNLSFRKKIKLYHPQLYWFLRKIRWFFSPNKKIKYR